MFKKKDRLPAFLFGATPLTNQAGASWRLFGPSEQSLFVPQAEAAKRTAMPTFGPSASQRVLEDIQCDFQLPFVDIVFVSNAQSHGIACGLTIFGEVYFWGTNYTVGSVNGEQRARVRAIRRANQIGIGKPIKQILGYNGRCIAVSSDGNVWKLSDDPRTPPENYSLPSSTQVEKAGFVGGGGLPVGLYAVDTSGNILIDRSASSASTPSMQFFRLSKWVESLEISDGGSYPGVADGTRIALAFTAAPAGGQTAAGEAEVNGETVTRVFLTTQGRGYEDAPTVSPASGNAAITASLFADLPLTFTNIWPIGQSGKAYGFGGIGSSRVPLGGNWKFLSTHNGQSAGVGIKASGELWAWGNADLGNSSNTPAKIADGNWLSVLCISANEAAAVRDDYTLWTWGRNWSGLLGDSTNWDARRTSPQQIASGREWVAVFGPQANTFECFLYAIQKDSVITSHTPSMQFWPDSYFAGTT
jgi:hypothetical protein